MVSYRSGIVVIIISILSCLWRLYRLKNCVEVDALVLITEEQKWPSETGAQYYSVFQYSVSGKEYITKCYTGNIEYTVGSIARVYCSRNFLSKDFTNVAVADTLGFHLFINIVLMVSGTILLLLGIFL